MATLLKPQCERKHHVDCLIGPHEFESIGSILGRMRMGLETQMVDVFDPRLSLEIDFLLDEEQRLREEGQP